MVMPYRSALVPPGLPRPTIARGGVNLGTPTGAPLTVESVPAAWPYQPQAARGTNNPPGTVPPGTPVSPALMPPTVAPVPPGATGLGARIKQAYTEASKRAGHHLTWDDPTVLLIWQVLGGLTAEQARAASLQGAQYANQNGRLLSDAEVDQAVGEVKTRLPNGNDVGYGLGDAVQQAFQTVQAQYPGSPLAANDPRLLAAVRQNPELAGITPEQLTQIVQAGRQFTGMTGQLAGAGLDTTIGTVLNRPAVPLPHQMNTGAFEALYGANADPTAKALAEAALKRRGWDPATYERQHYAARPVGTATAAPSWGGGAWATPSGVWS